MDSDYSFQVLQKTMTESQKPLNPGAILVRIAAIVGGLALSMYPGPEILFPCVAVLALLTLF